MIGGERTQNCINIITLGMFWCAANAQCQLSIRHSIDADDDDGQYMTGFDW